MTAPPNPFTPLIGAGDIIERLQLTGTVHRPSMPDLPPEELAKITKRRESARRRAAKHQAARQRGTPPPTCRQEVQALMADGRVRSTWEVRVALPHRAKGTVVDMLAQLARAGWLVVVTPAGARTPAEYRRAGAAAEPDLDDCDSGLSEK